MFNKKTDIEIILDSLNQVANNKELSSKIINDLVSRGIGSKKKNKMKETKNQRKIGKTLQKKKRRLKEKTRKIKNEKVKIN